MVTGRRRWRMPSTPLQPFQKTPPAHWSRPAFLAFSAGLLADIAGAIGRSDLAESYRLRAQEIAAAYHHRFFNPATGGYGSNNQACNSLSLFMGLVPAELRQGVLENLLADVVQQEYHLTTGNLCSKYALEVLSQMGQAGAALRLVTQTTYPSWGYMLENGATTIWERWEKATGGGMNSHNHPMYASVGSWLYKVVAGIDLGDDCAAFRRVTIWPRVTHELDWARASLQTAQGPVKVDWRRAAGQLTLNVTVPANCQARLILPRPTEAFQPPDGVIRRGGGGRTSGFKYRVRRICDFHINLNQESWFEFLPSYGTRSSRAWLWNNDIDHHADNLKQMVG